MVRLGYSCHYMHSNMPQAARNDIFSNFRSGKYKNLVSTDVFGRGIDVPDVNLVVNFDLPSTVETYLHRVGRAGRFGHLGLAINFITEKDQSMLQTLESKLGITIAPLPKDVDPALYTL